MRRQPENRQRHQHCGDRRQKDGVVIEGGVPAKINSQRQGRIGAVAWEIKFFAFRTVSQIGPLRVGVPGSGLEKGVPFGCEVDLAGVVRPRAKHQVAFLLVERVVAQVERTGGDEGGWWSPGLGCKKESWQTYRYLINQAFLTIIWKITNSDYSFSNTLPTAVQSESIRKQQCRGSFAHIQRCRGTNKRSGRRE